MNASHLFAGIYWPVMLMVLAAGWLLLPPGVVPTARAAQIHAAAAPLPDPVLQGDESIDEDEEKAQHPIRRPSASAVSSVPMRQQTSVAVASLRSRTSASSSSMVSERSPARSPSTFRPRTSGRGCRTSSRRLPEHMR